MSVDTSRLMEARRGRGGRHAFFGGKIAIPGDQMEAYFEAWEQFKNTKVPMRTQLEQCARDFEWALAQQYVPKTVRKHMAIIALFIDFVCWDTDVHRIEEITRGIANSAFRQWYLRKVGWIPSLWPGSSAR